LRSISRKVLLDEVQQAIDELQPNLKIIRDDLSIIISGVLKLTDQKVNLMNLK